MSSGVHMCSPARTPPATSNAPNAAASWPCRRRCFHRPSVQRRASFLASFHFPARVSSVTA